MLGLLVTGHLKLICVFFPPQLNLKFEIEVLCKNLSLDINDLKPGNLLKDKDTLKNLEEQLSAPKKEVKPPEEMLPVVTTGTQQYPMCLLTQSDLFRVLSKSLSEYIHFSLVHIFGLVKNSIFLEGPL